MIRRIVLAAVLAVVIALHEVVPGSATGTMEVIAAFALVALAVALELSVGRLAALRDELRRSDETYRSLVETLPLVTYVDQVEPAAVPWYIAPQIEGLVGYAAPEWHDDPELFWKILHPDDQVRVRAAHEELGTTLSSLSIDYRLLSKDGRVVWIHDEARVVDTSGTARIEGFLLDVTAEKEAHEALRIATERYRLIVESADQGIWLIDAASRTTFVNAKLTEMLGWSSEEMVGRPALDFVAPDRRAQAEENLRARESGRGQEYESRLRRKNGSVADVSIVASPVQAHAGEYLGALAMVTDVTEAKKAETERAYLVGIVMASHDAVIATELGGQIYSWNPGAEHMFGWTAAEAKKLHIAAIIPEDLLKESLSFREAVIGERRARTWETERMRRNGERFAVSMTLSPIIEASGEVVGVAGILRDITDQRQLADQLRQAQKMEAIGQLAGGVAHDFNNSLMAIRGYSELMLGRLADDDPMTTHASGIKKAADGATALTRQLLAFSRRQVLQPRVLDLNGVVEEMTMMLTRLIGEDVSLRTKLGPELGRVNADRGQLEQVLVNLVVNARDAMPGGGTVTVSTADVDFDDTYTTQHVVAESGPYVMLAVTDTGHGMTPEVRERMFEPFFTTKDQGRGTGMGLSTVYGIVKQSGGYIWAYSEPAHGTTIKVYLPRVAASPALDSPTAQAVPDGTETILVVEDEDLVRSVVREMLEGHGYRVLTAKSGQEALALFKGTEEHVDLVLTDVVMPEMNGDELAVRIAEIQPRLRTLFMSGYTDNAVVDDGVLAPGVEFLEKPFSADTLARKVREVLDDDAVAA